MSTNQWGNDCMLTGIVERWRCQVSILARGEEPRMRKADCAVQHILTLGRPHSLNAYVYFSSRYFIPVLSLSPCAPSFLGAHSTNPTRPPSRRPLDSTSH